MALLRKPRFTQALPSRACLELVITRVALRLIGGAFIALAIYVAAQAAYSLLAASRPEHSTLGILWAAVTCVVMLALAAGKARTGAALGNRVMQT